jgi:methyl-accepting chemotaxis protein
MSSLVRLAEAIENQTEKLKEQALRFANRRRIWIVNRPFQAKVVMYGFTIGGATLLATFAALKFFFWRCEQILIGQGLPFDHPIYNFVQQQERYLAFIFMVASLVSISFATWLGVTLSHRVAGPLHRMRRHLLEAASGRAPKELKFRENDYFKELAEAYNAELVSRGRVRRPGSEPARRDRNAA